MPTVQLHCPCCPPAHGALPCGWTRASRDGLPAGFKVLPSPHGTGSARQAPRARGTHNTTAKAGLAGGPAGAGLAGGVRLELPSGRVRGTVQPWAAVLAVGHSEQETLSCGGLQLLPSSGTSGVGTALGSRPEPPGDVGQSTSGPRPDTPCLLQAPLAERRHGEGPGSLLPAQAENPALPGVKTTSLRHWRPLPGDLVLGDARAALRHGHPMPSQPPDQPCGFWRHSCPMGSCSQQCPDPNTPDPCPPSVQRGLTATPSPCAMWCCVLQGDGHAVLPLQGRPLPLL